MNIAEHIAYLIGDSKRLVIPIYDLFRNRRRRDWENEENVPRRKKDGEILPDSDGNPRYLRSPFTGQQGQNLPDPEPFPYPRDKFGGIIPPAPQREKPSGQDGNPQYGPFGGINPGDSNLPDPEPYPWPRDKFGGIVPDLQRKKFGGVVPGDPNLPDPEPYPFPRRKFGGILPGEQIFPDPEPYPYKDPSSGDLTNPDLVPQKKKKGEGGIISPEELMPSYRKRFDLVNPTPDNPEDGGAAYFGSIVDDGPPGDGGAAYFGSIVPASMQSGGARNQLGPARDQQEENLYSRDLSSQETGPVNYIKKSVLEKWIKDTIAKVSKLVPSNLKLHLTKSKTFTAGDWNVNLSSGIGLDLNFLESSEITAVTRYDGEISYDCRQIPFHTRTKARFGSGFLEECSETDPVYYVNDMMLNVEPKPEDTHLDPLDGFCTIDYICYPDIDVDWDTMYGVPFDMQQVILIGTAVRCKKFQLDSLSLPALPVINPDFKIPQLDNPDIVDSIDIAKKLITDFEGSSFRDFILNEDISMATTALSGSAKALEIASTELAEQDKVSSIYLSEYSQNISKFAQGISEYANVYKKLANDYDVLQQEYQELLYSFRGELPGKKQMGNSEKKLAQIKQVVQN
tara:strand:- start:25267 stop:27138 length:1872 start_codon:yes stop_codon:yes gene_type:complete